MTPSERVETIRAIVWKLSQEPWWVMDLTLGQFGFQTTDLYPGDAQSYVVDMVQSGSDDALHGLADHLGVAPIGAVSVALGGGLWPENHFRLFISHTQPHKDYAKALQNRFDLYGISAFVAHVDIDPTDDWLERIELGLRTADALAAILTKDFHQSKWTDQEVGWALGNGRLVVPVRVDVDPYGLMGKYQALLSETGKPPTTALEVAKILIGHKLTRSRMLDPLVNALGNSLSYQQSKEIASLLEAADQLNEEQISRLLHAADDNSEVGDAFGVPAKVKALAKKMGYSELLPIPATIQAEPKDYDPFEED